MTVVVINPHVYIVSTFSCGADEAGWGLSWYTHSRQHMALGMAHSAILYQRKKHTVDNISPGRARRQDS